MTAAEIILDLGDHGFEDTAQERKLAVINAAYFNVLARRPWPFLLDQGTYAVVAVTGSVTLPTTLGIPFTVSDPTKGQLLRQITPMEYQRRFSHALEAQGTPRFWYQLGSSIVSSGRRMFVYPRPTAASSVLVTLLLQTSALTESAVDNDIYLPRTHHRLLVAGALTRLYAMEDDPEQATIFKQEFEEGIVRLETQFMPHPADVPRAEEGVANDAAADRKPAQ